MDLDGFLSRCDRLMERRAQLGRPLSEARLSTILFSCGPRLARLRAGRRIYHATLQQAEALLAAEEAKLAKLEEMARRHNMGSTSQGSRREPAEESQRVRGRTAEGGAP